MYADVFVPFIKAQAADNAEPFDFIEELLGLNDEYADEVAALSVIESLLCDEDFDNSRLMRHAKPRTLLLIEELQKS